MKFDKTTGVNPPFNNPKPSEIKHSIDPGLLPPSTIDWGILWGKYDPEAPWERERQSGCGCPRCTRATLSLEAEQRRGRGR